MFVLDHRESLTDDLPGNIGGCPPRYPELSSSYFEREIVWIAGLRARERDGHAGIDGERISRTWFPITLQLMLLTTVTSDPSEATGRFGG